jgi:hypothetical protein
MELARGIAHVSFPGGGFFLPARDPYDRQTLIEHVTQRVRAKGRVQVLVDSSRWIVEPTTSLSANTCTRCGETMDAACYPTSGSGVPYCVRCALSGGALVEHVQHHEWRQVG